jgi:Putative transposase/Transposase zinc-binding domain
MDRPRLHLADLLERHGDDFLARHGHQLTPEARRALCDIQICRTAALGGQARRCLTCGHVEVHYRSCGNRNCPRCGAGKRAAWLEREAEVLLPVPYHHVVFTLPAALHDLARRQPRLIYELLFQSASTTIREVAADPKYLGAQVGLLLTLHTWGQNLHLHPHVHGLVTAGGLSCDADGQLDAEPHWRSCRPGFFLPVRVLSRVYRGKFVAGLRSVYARGEVQGFLDAEAFERWCMKLYEHDWVVYAQPPAPGPEVVLKYLARYVCRVALSESRLVKLENGRVTFTVKDYKAGGKQRELTLGVDEFLRRWTQHVLPRGFVAARHYGLLANRGRQEKLALCQQLLWPLVYVLAGVKPAAEQPEPCPRCGSGPLVYAGEVAADECLASAQAVGVDSS